MIRRALFRIRYWRDIRCLDACSCGTRGSCMVCVSISEWLRDREIEWGWR